MSDPVSLAADPAALERLRPMLDLLERSTASLSSVTDPERALEVHLLDSLSGTLVDELDSPARLVDIGSGAGLPGIPLAAARPGLTVDLIDSVGRKVDFIQTVIDELGLENARAIKTRSEDLADGEGAEAYDVATARAVAPLAVLAELASPLLSEGGVLIAWKGSRNRRDEGELEAIADRVAMKIDRVVAVRPFPSSRRRHLYVIRKVASTPAGLPRRAGMARKRPLTG